MIPLKNTFKALLYCQILAISVSLVNSKVTNKQNSIDVNLLDSFDSRSRYSLKSFQQDPVIGSGDDEYPYPSTEIKNPLIIRSKGIDQEITHDSSQDSSEIHASNLDNSDEQRFKSSVTVSKQRSSTQGRKERKFHDKEENVIIYGENQDGSKESSETDSTTSAEFQNQSTDSNSIVDGSARDAEEEEKTKVEHISNNDCYGSSRTNQKQQVLNQTFHYDEEYENYLRGLIMKSKFRREILNDAWKEGAVCLDGSPPAIYFRKGSGSGKKKWIFFFEGGAWCYNKEECYDRSKTELGTSRKSQGYFLGYGILSRHRKLNRHFYNWNVVILDYCDGSSFSGDVSMPVFYNGVYIYFRGKRILDFVLKTFLNRGMDSADHVLVTGRSAGGLASMLHADNIRKRIPKTSKFHVLSDGGFFLDIKSKDGTYKYRGLIKDLVKLHNISSGVNEDCAKRNENELWKCFFPQYFLSDIKSPLFLVNSLYDTWSIASIYGVNCTMWDYTSCNFDEAVSVLRYRRKTLHEFYNSQFKKSKSGGVFFTSCIAHCLCSSEKWKSMVIKNKSMETSFISWMKGDQSNMLIDGEYPDNHSC